MRPYIKKINLGVRYKALAEFLNDEPTRLGISLYSWRGTHYEVIPYKVALQRHNWSSFIKYEYKGKLFGIREASEYVMKKYYGKELGV